MRVLFIQCFLLKFYFANFRAVSFQSRGLAGVKTTELSLVGLNRSTPHNAVNFLLSHSAHVPSKLYNRPSPIGGALRAKN